MSVVDVKRVVHPVPLCSEVNGVRCCHERWLTTVLVNGGAGADVGFRAIDDG
jgi:hypothetical protein